MRRDIRGFAAAQCGRASPYRPAFPVLRFRGNALTACVLRLSSPRLSLGERTRSRQVPERQSLSARLGGRAALNMRYGWYVLFGNIGVALMVVGYLLLQAEKLRSSDLSYSLMNAVGALLVLISLLYRFNLSAFLVEGFWLLISIYGLIKFAARPRAKESR